MPSVALLNHAPFIVTAVSVSVPGSVASAQSAVPGSVPEIQDEEHCNEAKAEGTHRHSTASHLQLLSLKSLIIEGWRQADLALRADVAFRRRRDELAGIRTSDAREAARRECVATRRQSAPESQTNAQIGPSASRFRCDVSHR